MVGLKEGIEGGEGGEGETQTVLKDSQTHYGVNKLSQAKGLNIITSPSSGIWP